MGGDQENSAAGKESSFSSSLSKAKLNVKVVRERKAAALLDFIHGR